MPATPISLLPDPITTALTDKFPIARSGTTYGPTLAEAAKTIIASGNLYQYINGFEPDKLSTNVLNINPGSCVSDNGLAIVSTSSLFAINMATTGVNGLDTGAPVNGTGYYVYLIRNNTTGAVAGVISTSITYGGVVVPAGYTIHRKLRFGFIYHSVNWDGIPDFHLTNWPMPFIRLTQAETIITWRALNLGVAAVWTDVDLTPWVPDNARIAYVQSRVTPGAGAGSAYIRSYGAQATGLLVGSASSAGPSPDAFGGWWIRLTSDRKLQYQITGVGSLSLYVLGYAMTEPS